MIAYNKDPIWNDIIPEPQEESEDAVVQIMYSEECKKLFGCLSVVTMVMDYFRAILRKDERSQRALDLTSDVVRLNSANYTAWYFRRLCLEALGSDLKEELRFVSAMALESPKNYQLWQHRRWIILQNTSDPIIELEHTAEVLKEDSKNYHAWAHRQWAIKEFHLEKDELSYTADLIEEDPRNNSAWNQRFFVHSLGEFRKSDAMKEIEFAFSVIERTPNNQSPWNYVNGLLDKFEFESELVAFAKEMSLEIVRSNHSCHYALALLVDIEEQSNTTGDIETAKLVSIFSSSHKIAV